MTRDFYTTVQLLYGDVHKSQYRFNITYNYLDNLHNI